MRPDVGDGRRSAGRLCSPVAAAFLHPFAGMDRIAGRAAAALLVIGGAALPGMGCELFVRMDGREGSGLPVSFEREPNDTSAAAGGPFTPPVLLGGAIEPAGDVDIFALELPATADLKIASFDACFDPAGPGTCAGIDTVVTLLGADGEVVLVERDQDGVGSCATIDSAAAGGAGARHLPAGTYFVKVADFLNDGVIPGYRLLITYNALCGDGVVAGAEECDGGPGCSSTCDRIPVCGDGLVDAPETCDDGNTTPGDGCDAACRLELAFEVEPNDDARTATGPFSPHVLVEGAISPREDVDHFSFTLGAISDVRIETFDGDGPGSCVAVDTVVALYDERGRELAREDDGGIGGCSRIDPTDTPAARRLPPGRYVVSVEDQGNNTVIPAYRLVISVVASCGNGVVEGSEECDGGPGCDARCERVPVCGDGLVDAPETCDDGGRESGDGCDADCQLEVVEEVEPNDDPAAADAHALGRSAFRAGRVTRFRGAIPERGDRDLFRIDLPEDSVVRLETFDATARDCDVTTTLRLRDAAGAERLSDDNSGISACSALVLHLEAGTYYAEVAGRGHGGVVSGYILEAKVVARGGTESEPNDSPLRADVVNGDEVFVLGALAASGDADFFAITVPDGRSIRAEVIEGGAKKTCESMGIDSALTLYHVSGVLLGGDDDGGRGLCSRIDGTGASPADAYASRLPADTYLLKVAAAPFAQRPGDPRGRFEYRLVVTIR